jgi:hypothetical protein
MARMHDRKSRQAAVKTRIGIAAAVLAGSGSIAAVAIAAANHGAVTVARPAAYAARFGNEGTTLSSVLNEWGQSTRSTQAAYSALAGLTQARQFSQAAHGGQTLDVQRGIVVLATKKFIILQSARGSLHLWLLSAGTHFRNVSDTTAGTAALTASSSATQQAMSSGNMIPATTLLAGSPTVAAALLTQAPAAQTVSVHVANTNLTVTVTVTRSMATITQTATTPLNAMPASSPVTYMQDAWQATHSLARGDLAVVAGFRSRWTLHAKLVLFSPLSTASVGGRAAAPRAASTPATTPTSW